MVKLKFIIVAQSLPNDGFGGSGKVSQDWYNILNKIGIIELFITPNRVFDSNLKLTTFNCFTALENLSRIDWIVVLHGWGFETLFWTALSKVSSKKLFRFGDLWPIFKGIDSIKCHTAIYNSALIKKKLQDNIIPERSFLLNNFLNESSIVQPKKSDNIVRFIFLGRLVEHKGIYILPRIANELIKMGQENFIIDIYGSSEKDNEEVKLHELILSLGVSNNVRMKGFLERGKSVETISKYDFMLFPSLYRFNKTIEGQPNVLLESFAANTPVLGNFFDSSIEHVRPGFNCLTINSEKSIDWAIAISPILLKNYSKEIFKNNCASSIEGLINNDSSEMIYNLLSNSKFKEETHFTNDYLGNWGDVKDFLYSILDQGMKLIDNVFLIDNGWQKRDSLKLQYIERLSIGAFIKGCLESDFSELRELITLFFEVNDFDVKYSMKGGCFGLMEILRPGEISILDSRLNQLFEAQANSASPDNNHILFHLVQAVISKSEIAKSQLERIMSFIDEDGLFMDGKHQVKDYYNSWGFMLYLPFIQRYLKKDDSSGFDYELKIDYDIFIASFIKEFFSEDGYPIPYGRSLSYRFGITSCFYPVLINHEYSHKSIELMSVVFFKTMNMFFSNVGSLGLFYPGWLGVSKSEEYTDFGSSLWALWAFLPLLLPEQHVFWNKYKDEKFDVLQFWWGELKNEKKVSKEKNFGGKISKLQNKILYNGVYSSEVNKYLFPGVNAKWPQIYD